MHVYKLDNYTHLQHAAQKVNNYVNGCDTLLSHVTFTTKVGVFFIDHKNHYRLSPSPIFLRKLFVYEIRLAKPNYNNRHLLTHLYQQKQQCNSRVVANYLLAVYTASST